MEKNNFRIIIIFLTTFIYAVIRYNVFGGVSLTDIPVYIMNKTAAFSIVGLILLIIFDKENDFEYVKTWMKILITFHVVVSLILLNSHYFPKYFENSRLTFEAGVSVFFGTAAFIYGLIKKNEAAKNVAILLVMLHVLFMGIKGWFDIKSWHGYLPPITLLSFISLFVGLLLNKKN